MLGLLSKFFATKANLLVAIALMGAVQPVFAETISEIPASLNLTNAHLNSKNEDLLNKAYACQINLDIAREFSLEPNSAPAFELQGDIEYTCNEEFDTAIADYKKAIEVFNDGFDPPPTHLYLKLAESQVAAGQTSDALDTYKFIIAQDPIYGFVMVGDRGYSPLGEAATVSISGDESAAPRASEKSFEASAYFELGRSLEQHGHLSEAIEAYEQAIDLSPTFAHAYSALSYAYFQRQAPDYIEDALATVETALKLNPDLLWAKYYQGNYLILNGDQSGGFTAFFYVINAHASMNTFKEEIKLSMAIELAAEAFLEQNNLDRAITMYQEVLYLDSSDISAYIALGNTWLQKGENTKAIAVLKEGLGHVINMSQQARFYYEIAKVRILNHQWEGAKLYLEKAISLNMCGLFIYSPQFCFTADNPFASQMTDVQSLLDYIQTQIDPD